MAQCHQREGLQRQAAKPIWGGGWGYSQNLQMHRWGTQLNPCLLLDGHFASLASPSLFHLSCALRGRAVNPCPGVFLRRNFGGPFETFTQNNAGIAWLIRWHPRAGEGFQLDSGKNRWCFSETEFFSAPKEGFQFLDENRLSDLLCKIGPESAKNRPGSKSREV